MYGIVSGPRHRERWNIDAADQHSAWTTTWDEEWIRPAVVDSTSQPVDCGSHFLRLAGCQESLSCVVRIMGYSSRPMSNRYPGIPLGGFNSRGTGNASPIWIQGEGKAQHVARPACANATAHFLLICTLAMLLPPSEWPLKTSAQRILVYVDSPTMQMHRKISGVTGPSSPNL